ncbi:hypothetical protein A2159_00120 [Candidatus Woesebacteria bacterium RBG_13_34_9]|uniref:Uncharacterized protein n=1 Tax=Candidatus Woesebacteria bacterium RBG_13_34_9 TaxID=1802477 RepID=A0A1F7X3T6_9BACT|nr:MAG: hypothetical protein A2159_00120 [Candidatus Woesebacteria bacterium RBG_13_34_9]
MRKKDFRQKKIRLRKNFFLTAIVIILLWTLLALFIYFVEPNQFAAIPTFFVLLFFSLLFTTSTIFANSRRGTIISLTLIIFLFLRYIGVGNIINLLLLIGLVISTEIYFSKR